jgi:hypothetical protein
VGTAIGGIVGSIGGSILGADGMEALSQKLLGLNSDNRTDNSSKIPKANPDKPQTIEQTLATIGSLKVATTRYAEIARLQWWMKHPRPKPWTLRKSKRFTP